jgi:glycosyltransferase involved in cell wall biosynthesis
MTPIMPGSYAGCERDFISLVAMKILFLSRWYPYPPNNGSKLRVYNLINGLAKSHEVTLLSFIDDPDMAINNLESRAPCDKVKLVPWENFNPANISAKLGFFSLRPRSLIDTHSPEMERQIQEFLAGEDYDIVIASQITAASYSRYFNGVPALFEEVELSVPYEEFTQAKSALRRFRNGLTWAKHRRYVARLLKDYRACTVVSERERQLLLKNMKDYTAVQIIPNCVNLSDYQDFHEAPQPDTLIFTGSFQYSPNYQGMVWFLSEVYPRIQSQVPDINLTITGEHAGCPLPESNSVTLTGYVDDVRFLIARSWISIAPIFTGGGTRLKILEAVALGTPVVATTKGAEGLDLQSEQHLLIADTPEAFARQILRLLKGPGLRNQLAENAYRLVRERYDWAIVMPRFLNLIEAISTA